MELGFEIARRYEATVDALHVVDSPPMERKLEVTASSNVSEPLPGSWYDSGDSATERIAERVTERGVEAAIELRRGDPAREIASYITDEGIDLVCMGTRGHTE